MFGEVAEQVRVHFTDGAIDIDLDARSGRLRAKGGANRQKNRGQPVHDAAIMTRCVRFEAGRAC